MTRLIVAGGAFAVGQQKAVKNGTGRIQQLLIVGKGFT
jgi:hypothetical protein